MSQEPLITARELAGRLGISADTVLDWWEAGQLPGFRLGGGERGPVRFRWSEVEVVLESWRLGPRVEVAAHLEGLGPDARGYEALASDGARA